MDVRPSRTFRVKYSAPRVGVVLLLLGAQGFGDARPAAAQNCEVNKGPDHADWQTGYVTQRALERDLETIVREAGIVPFGGVHIETPDPQTDPTLQYVGLELPGDVQEVVRARIVEFTREHVVPRDSGTAETDTPHYRSLTVQLGAPDTPLWPDSTVSCAPRLRNSAEVRSLLHRLEKPA